MHVDMERNFEVRVRRGYKQTDCRGGTEDRNRQVIRGVLLNDGDRREMRPVFWEGGKVMLSPPTTDGARVDIGNETTAATTLAYVELRMRHETSRGLRGGLRTPGGGCQGAASFGRS
jgi:hypothetical protein